MSNETIPICWYCQHPLDKNPANPTKKLTQSSLKKLAINYFCCPQRKDQHRGFYLTHVFHDSCLSDRGALGGVSTCPSCKGNRRGKPIKITNISDLEFDHSSELLGPLWKLRNPDEEVPQPSGVARPEGSSGRGRAPAMEVASMAVAAVVGGGSGGEGATGDDDLVTPPTPASYRESSLAVSPVLQEAARRLSSPRGQFDSHIPSHTPRMSLARPRHPAPSAGTSIHSLQGGASRILTSFSAAAVRSAGESRRDQARSEAEAVESIIELDKEPEIPRCNVTAKPAQFIAEKFNSRELSSVRDILKAIKELHYKLDSNETESMAGTRIDSVYFYTRNQILYSYVRNLFQRSESGSVSIGDFAEISPAGVRDWPEQSTPSFFCETIMVTNIALLKKLFEHHESVLASSAPLVVRSVIKATVSHSMLRILQEISNKEYNSVYSFILFLFHHTNTAAMGFISTMRQLIDRMPSNSQGAMQLNTNDYWDVIAPVNFPVTHLSIRYSPPAIAVRCAQRVVELFLPFFESPILPWSIPTPITKANYADACQLLNVLRLTGKFLEDHRINVRALQEEWGAGHSREDYECNSRSTTYVDRFIDVLSKAIMLAETSGWEPRNWLLVNKIRANNTIANLFSEKCAICTGHLIPRDPSERTTKTLMFAFQCSHYLCLECYVPNLCPRCPTCQSEDLRRSSSGSPKIFRFFSFDLIAPDALSEQQMTDLLAMDVQLEVERQEEARRQREAQEKQNREEEERRRDYEQSSTQYTDRVHQAAITLLQEREREREREVRETDTRLVDRRSSLGSSTAALVSPATAEGGSAPRATLALPRGGVRIKLSRPEGVVISDAMATYFVNVELGRTQRAVVTIESTENDLHGDTITYNVIREILALLYACVKIQDGKYVYPLMHGKLAPYEIENLKELIHKYLTSLKELASSSYDFDTLEKFVGDFFVDENKEKASASIVTTFENTFRDEYWMPFKISDERIDFNAAREDGAAGGDERQADGE